MQQVWVFRFFFAAAFGVAVLVTIFVLVEGLLLNLVIIAMGHVTGSILGAVEHGVFFFDGCWLIGALVIVVGIYVLLLLRGLFDDALLVVVGVRMQVVLQWCVIDVVLVLVGIVYFEDQEVFDKFESVIG